MGRVVAQIVDVPVKVDGFDEVEGSTFVDKELALAAGGEKLLRFRRVDDALGMRDPRNAMAAHAGADVDDFHAVVPQRSDDQLIFPVEAKMVEASLDACHRNRFGQYQWTRCVGRRRFLGAKLRWEGNQKHAG